MNCVITKEWQSCQAGFALQEAQCVIGTHDPLNFGRLPVWCCLSWISKKLGGRQAFAGKWTPPEFGSLANIMALKQEYAG